MTGLAALRLLGHRVLSGLREIGVHGVLLGRILGSGGYLIGHRHLIAEQMMRVGVASFPLVTVVSLFTGAVSAWQAAYQFQDLLPLDFLGAAVNAAILIELGPVLTGLVVAGRVGASIAAEIGTMAVTEQIDALESLAIDPVQYLAAPRFTAGLTMLPVLVIYADIIGHAGAYVVALFLLDISTATFFGSVQQYFSVYNVFSGLIKALFFGGGTALIGCAIGFRTGGGATGVGRSTIRAFVYSSAFILIMDYILALFLF